MGPVVMLTSVMRHDIEEIWAVWRVCRNATSGETPEAALEFEDPPPEDAGDAEGAESAAELEEEEPPPNIPPMTCMGRSEARARARAVGNRIFVEVGSMHEQRRWLMCSLAWDVPAR